MFTEWCESCGKPMKCHNIDGQLHCIGCKQQLETLPKTQV